MERKYTRALMIMHSVSDIGCFLRGEMQEQKSEQTSQAMEPVPVKPIPQAVKSMVHFHLKLK